MDLLPAVNMKSEGNTHQSSWNTTRELVDSTMDSRKRKLSDMNDLSDDDESLKHQKVEADGIKKQNHSEIEKRRRDKMNTYITELSSMVPMCNAMSRKLDKLTVLRMAVQHIKSLRVGSINSYTEGHYKPAFLSDEELKHLILEAAEGFLFIVSCDRGRILYVSESVVQVLKYSQGDLLGQSWFDILHPKDIAKVKEQLSSSDLLPKEKLIDAKTMLPVKTDMPQSQTRLSPGARRSFFCRMKCKAMATVKEEADTTTGCHRRRKSQNYDRKFCVIHCTGYLKSWAPAKLNLAEESEGESESCNLSCLVSVGRVHPGLLRPGPLRANCKLQPMEFVSRHTMDGKFLFVDQRATLFLGYLPQELLGTSGYEYFHQDDILHMAETHRQVLRSGDSLLSGVYRFRTKEGSYVYMQTKWKTFRNPWTKEFEYLVAVNTLVPAPDHGLVESSSTPLEEGLSSNSNSLDAVLSSLPSNSMNNYNGNSNNASCSSSNVTNNNASPIYISSNNNNHGGTNAGTGTSSNSNHTAEMVNRLMGSRMRAGKIGQLIADDLLDNQKNPGGESNLNNGPSLETLVGTLEENRRGSLSRGSTTCMVDGLDETPMLNGGHNMGGTVGNNCHSPHSNQSNQFTPSHNDSDSDLMDSVMGRELLQASYQNNSNEGNDEAAMAVIMSLLEADAGLGGPVDFSGLPWPLP